MESINASHNNRYELLFWAFGLQALGHAWQLINGKVGWGLYSFMQMGIGRFSATFLLVTLVGLMLFCAFQLLFGQELRLKLSTLKGLSLLAFSVTMTKFIQAGGDLSLVSRSAHWLAPLGLMLLLNPATASKEWGTELLRFGIGGTFIGHGLKCLMQDQTIAGIITYHLNFLGLEADTLLPFSLNLIGLLDVSAGVVVILSPWRWACAYMAMWVALAIVARYVSGGNWFAFDEILMRASYVAIPLWLFRHGEVNDSKSKFSLDYFVGVNQGRAMARYKA